MKLIEYSLLSVTAGISLLISGLDLAGLLDADSWVIQRIPSLTLLATGFVASYLILERRGKLEKIARSSEVSTKNILKAVATSASGTIQALDGVELKSFQSDTASYSYLVERLSAAKKVNDITWEVDIQPLAARDIEALESYRKIVMETARKPDVIWREIVIFTSKKKFERFRTRLIEDVPSYNLVYYDELPKNSPRKLHFMIIDNEEVFLLGRNISLIVKHPDIVTYFSEYYKRLWSEGKILKINGNLNCDELQKLEDIFK